MKLARAVAWPILALTLAACGGAPESSGSAHKSGDPPAGPAGTFGDAPTGAPAGDTPAGGQANEVWAHSIDTLFKLDPITKQVEIVAPFSGCTTDVIDIALDADSNLFGATDNDGGKGALWSIDRKTAVCTKIADGEFPNSLSFVPKGTVDPNAEALVGYQDNNDYVRIDTKTGAVTKIGTLGQVGFASSGDIVSVKGGATYLTVTGTDCGDCLVEVNPATGAIVKQWGSLGHDQVYGIAFWAGSVYGFDNAGELFEVTFAGGTLATKDIPIPAKKAGLQFGGAGSTTSAPVAPPR
jgi:hypothetical protein